MKKSVLLANVTCTEASKDVVLMTCELLALPPLPEAMLICQPQLQSVALLLDGVQPESLAICNR